VGFPRNTLVRRLVNNRARLALARLRVSSSLYICFALAEIISHGYYEQCHQGPRQVQPTKHLQGRGIASISVFAASAGYASAHEL
jgi:hypothetical protein